MPRHGSPLCAAAVLVCCLAACTGTSGAGSSPKASGPTAKTGASRSATSSSGTASSTSSPSSTTADPNRPITFAFAGDIHFEDYLAPLARDPQGLTPLIPLWGGADLVMANLETAITERGTKIGKEFHFRAPASALQTLANAGITVLTQANNHGVDYGPVGLKDTLAARANSPIPIVGIGKDEQDAFAPHLETIRGLKVAVFGVDQVYEMTLARFSAGPDKGGVASSMPTTRIVNAIKEIRDKVDVVVVYLHWGYDYQECPDGTSTGSAAALEQAGADVIVGAHSHRVDGAGWLGTSYVDYGLGNFVWWRSKEPDSRTGVLTLTIDPARAKATHPGDRSRPIVTAAKWNPLLIGTDGIPAKASAADTTRLHKLWQQASACTGLATKPR